MTALLLLISLIILPWLLRLVSIEFAVPGFKDGLPRRKYIVGYYVLCAICAGLVFLNGFHASSGQVGCYRLQGIEIHVGDEQVLVRDMTDGKILARARIENVERVRGWLLQVDKKVTVQIGGRSVNLVGIDSIFIRQTWSDGTFLVAYDGDRTVMFPRSKC